MTRQLYIKLVLTLITIIFATSCATVEKGTFLGTFIGSAIGYTAGSQQELPNDQRNNGIAIGALIGGAIGYFATKSKLEKERLKNIEPLGADATPKLKMPRVRKIWVQDQIVGDEFVSGHWKYLIDQPAVWTKEE